MIALFGMNHIRWKRFIFTEYLNRKAIFTE